MPYFCPVVGSVAERPELVDYIRAWMPLPSGQRGAARAPLPPDQLASFYKLVDKKVIAGALSRYARNAELSGLACTQAEALFGDDSLVVASLRYSESESFNSLSLQASGAEKEALLRRSWGVLEHC